MNTDEREERLKEIRERVNERALYADPPLWDDIEFLLLQVAPPVLTREESKLVIGAIPLQSGLLDGAATRMRERCVRRLDEQRNRLLRLYSEIFTMKSTGDPKHPLQAVIDYDVKTEFENALESLTLDEEK